MPDGTGRYAYGLNNPVRYNDPSGHWVCEGEDCKLPNNDDDNNPTQDKEANPQTPVLSFTCNSCASGWQFQATFSFGFPSDTYRGDEKVSFLIFYGLSVVTDAEGGIQIYGLTRDINFSPNLVQGPAEKEYPTGLLSYGLTFATGPIFGEGFAERQGGTENYAEQAIDYVGGIGPISVDYYEAFDAATGKTNPNWVSGIDIGYSIGAPLSYGRVATYAHPITRRFDLKR